MLRFIKGFVLGLSVAAVAMIPVVPTHVADTGDQTVTQYVDDFPPATPLEDVEQPPSHPRVNPAPPTNEEIEVPVQV